MIKVNRRKEIKTVKPYHSEVIEFLLAQDKPRYTYVNKVYTKLRLEETATYMAENHSNRMQSKSEKSIIMGKLTIIGIFEGRYFTAT